MSIKEKHGIETTEIENNDSSVTNPTFTPLFAVGKAPVHLSTTGNPVNEPIIAYSFEEAKAKLGYSTDFESYTLCEVMYSHFILYNSPSPVIFVNVLDPAVHKKTTSPGTVNVTGGTVLIEKQGVILDTLVVKNAAGATTYVRGLDYIAGYDEQDRVLISVLTGGSIGSAPSLQITYDQVDPSSVDYSDVIGGTDVGTGEKTGIELIDDVFVLFQLVPALAIAPGFTDDPTVAGLLVSKLEAIDSTFEGFAITDLDSSLRTYDVADWKEENGYTSPLQYAAYPKGVYNDMTFHLSTLIAGAMCATDAANNGVPYASPSNKSLKIEAPALDDGTKIRITISEADYLNNKGIVTIRNMGLGFKVWGNRTGAFPEFTDSQRAFVPVRRMFGWTKNRLKLDFLARIDEPMNNRLVQRVLDDANIWLNSLVGAGYFLGARIEFLQSDNPTSELEQGRMVFSMAIAPPPPAQAINFKIEYDASYFASLFQ